MLGEESPYFALSEIRIDGGGAFPSQLLHGEDAISLLLPGNDRGKPCQRNWSRLPRFRFSAEYYF